MALHIVSLALESRVERICRSQSNTLFYIANETIRKEISKTKFQNVEYKEYPTKMKTSRTT